MADGQVFKARIKWVQLMAFNFATYSGLRDRAVLITGGAWLGHGRAPEGALGDAGRYDGAPGASVPAGPE